MLAGGGSGGERESDGCSGNSNRAPAGNLQGLSVRGGVLLCQAQGPGLPERLRESGQGQDQPGPEHRPPPGRAY